MPATGWLQTTGCPIGWRLFALGIAAMLALAGRDMLGAALTKASGLHQQPVWFVAGLAAFALLSVVYAARRHLAELAVVILGWLVFLRDGLQALDHVRYGVSLPPGTSLAIAAILVLQAYLALAPNGEAG